MTGMKIIEAEEFKLRANAALREQIITFLAHCFDQDPGHRWLLGERSRKTFLAALPHYFRFILSLALSCEAITSIIFEDQLRFDQNKRDSVEASLESRVYVPSCNKIKGISIVIPPHGSASFDSTLNSIYAGAWKLPFRCGPGLMWRLLKTWLPMLDSVHEQIFPDPVTKYDNWYLFYIAVHPEHQGQRIGSEMINDMFARIISHDRLEESKLRNQGLPFSPRPVYLEASGLASRRLYERMGFKDVCTGYYGKVAEGQEVNIAKDGTVLGGSQYGMICDPVPNVKNEVEATMAA